MHSDHQRLRDTEGPAGNRFGVELDVEDGWMAVGAPADHGAKASAVLIYRWKASEGEWTLYQRLEKSDMFGGAVDLQGRRLVAMTTGEKDVGYVYERTVQGSAGIWQEIGRMEVTDETEGNLEMDVDGNRLVLANYHINRRGHILVYDISDPGDWNLLATRREPEEAAGGDGNFASDVAISGETIAAVDSVDGPGEIHIYERHEGGRDNWGHTQTLRPSDGEKNDGFGFGIELDGDLLVAGSRDPGTGNFNGSMFVFERGTSGRFEATAQIFGVPDSGRGFAEAIALSDGHGLLAVTSKYNLVVIFRRAETSTGWREICRFQPEMRYPVDTYNFGRALDVSDGRAVVGVPSKGEETLGVALAFEMASDGMSDRATVEEEGSTEIDVLANDPEGSELALVTQPPHGETRLVDGEVVYEPEPDFSGTDAFDYILTGAEGCTSPTPVEVIVQPVNDPPVATDDRVEAGDEQQLRIDVLENDWDPDGDTLTLAVVESPSKGSTTIADGTIGYIAEPGASGEDELLYRIEDGKGEADTATVTIEAVSNAVSRTCAFSADAGDACEDEDNDQWNSNDDLSLGEACGCSSSRSSGTIPVSLLLLLIVCALRRRE